MRIDVVVEELGAMEAETRRREVRRDLAAEHRVLALARFVDRHMDVDVRPDHEVVADAAGCHGFAEMLQETEEVGLLEQAVGSEQEIASRIGALGRRGHGPS